MFSYPLGSWEGQYPVRTHDKQRVAVPEPEWIWLAQRLSYGNVAGGGSLIPAALATEKMKKSNLAAFAERTVKATTWLPQVLRAPADKAGKNRVRNAA